MPLIRMRWSHRTIWLAAPALIVFTACQSSGEFTSGSATPTHESAPMLVTQPTLLAVHPGITRTQVILQFDPGATLGSARAFGRGYGLDLVDGPLMRGPSPAGQYVFEAPQAVVEAITPTTARVYFSSSSKQADRLSFLADNHLRFVHWLRPDDGVVIALVKLPPANLKPILIDQTAGLFQITLPVGLDQQSVATWASTAGLTLISYLPVTGVAVVHPNSWTPPVTAPVRAYLRPRANTPAPAPTATTSVLYVQFDGNLTASDISSIAQGLTLGLVSLSASNLAVLSVDPSRAKAEIQLLSDLATVQCVGVSPTPCPQGSAAAALPAPAPAMQPLSQPRGLTMRVTDGVLELDWSAASGATGYAIFKSADPNGPFELAAIVAGQQHTSFQAFDLIGSGGSVYYQVLAVHPCLPGGDSTDCDASSVMYSQGGAAASWTNTPATPPAAVVAPVAAAPSASPVPSPPPSSSPSAQDPTSAPSPSASPIPSPAAVVAPVAPPAPPMQTRAAAGPLAAPAPTATSSDGHVTIAWSAVPGATAYRLYRSTDGGSAFYIGQTSDLSFTDVGGRVGAGYGYAVAGVAANGLVGNVSAQSPVTWAAATTTPSVIRSLPAEATPLSGRVRFQIDAQSGTGSGSVLWKISGPAAARTIGVADGQPNAQSPLAWSAALTWDTDAIPDGTYTVTATITDAGGPEVTSTTSIRVQNGAPAAPTSLSAVAQPGGVALTWQQSASETTAVFRLFRDAPITGTPLINLSADRSTYVDGAAGPGSHIYQLVALDSAGHMSVPATASVTIGAVAVSAPVAAQTPDLKLLLPNGQAVAPGGRVTDRVIVVAPAIEGLRVQLTSDSTTWSDVGQLPTCGEQCTLDFDLRALVPGAYLIRASTGSQSGNPHSFVRSEPVRYRAPGALTATAGALGVNLSWNPPAAAFPSSYVIERKVSDGDWQSLDRVAATSYIDSRAPTGTNLSYRVMAVDSEGTTGVASNEAALLLPAVAWAQQETLAPPPAPIGVEVSTSHGRVTLQWQHVPGSDGYAIERQSAPGGAFVLAGNSGDESFSDSQALSAGQYAYRVIALSGPAAGPASHEVSALVIPSTPPAPMTASGNPGGAAPPVPTTIKASPSNGSLVVSWSPASGTAPSSTYTLYRMNPETGVFTIAASQLRTTSFIDSALIPGSTYGYVVTAASPGGLESPFSSPAWVGLPSTPGSLNLDLRSLPSSSVVPDSRNLLAVAQVSAAAGLAGISFALSTGRGRWQPLPSAPIDPASPNLPGAMTAAGSAFLWGSTINTTSLAAGSYQLRVQTVDTAGRAQEKIESFDVANAAARAPPTVELNARPFSGGVHLEWNSVGDTYTVQRSLFGADGPFETIATSQSSSYDDTSAISGLTYSYRILGETATPLYSTSATASAGPITASATVPVLQLGGISQSELSISAKPASQTQPLDTGVRALGSTYDISATSLATGLATHRLSEPAQVTFALPPGLSGADSSAATIYHWDEVTSSWVNEISTVDTNAGMITATIDHLSPFVLVSTASVGSGALAQQPAPPQSADGSPSADATAHLPVPPAPLTVAPDGEVTSLRSAYSAVFKNPDGSLRQVIKGDLVNYKDAAGVWQKVETSLVPAASGYVANAAGPLQVELPADLGKSPIRVGDTTFTIEGARSSARQSGGSTATYSAVLDGVDAGYTALPSGLRENLVITRRPGRQLTFSFDLSTGNLSLQLARDGSVDAVDPAGRTQFTINSPWMHDAATSQSELGQQSNDIAVTLTGGSGSYRLTYTPDAAWLDDPARIYPVTVDPSFFSANDQYDDQINSYSSGFNYHGYTYMPVGYTYFSSPCCASDPSRGMIQFSTSSILADGFYASSATLYAYQYTDYDCSRSWEPNGTVVHASAAAGSWSYTGVTWSNQPGYTDSYGTAAATTMRCSTGWLGWNVLGLLRSWETHAIGNYGFVLHADGENGSANNSENFYGFNSGTSPYMNVYYDTYSYTSAVALPTSNVLPNGGTTPVDVAISNVGSATWGTDTRLSYRWWYGGSAITSYTASIYVPYNVPSGTSIDLHFNLVAPSITTTGPVYLQLALLNNSFWFSSLAWGSPSYSCDQFYAASLSCSSGTAITLADESGTIAWQGAPQVVSAVAGSLLSIPLTLTNTSVATGRNYTWHAYDAADLVRVGIRDYRSTSGSITPLANLPNLRTYLSADVAAQGSVNVTAVIQAPGDPGDYLLRVDLVHETPSTIRWFADQGNQPLEVHARILAPGDDKTSHVPMALGDGSALGINTSNGFASFSAGDMNIPERGNASLQLTRRYNGVNGILPSLGTSATNSTYGIGWTFNFQRTVHLGSLGANTYDPSTGILTDAQGRAWTLAWNPSRGLYEDAAANRTLAPSSAQVTTSTGSVSVPGVRPIDLLNGSGAVVADSTAPGGYALRLEGTAVPPTALVIPTGVVPVQQNGSIEFWFRPNFDMSTDTSCHVFFGDAQLRFGLAWNCPSGTYPWGSPTARALDFFTYDSDSSAYNILSSAAVTWANGSWHHVAITWAEGGAKQLMTDATLYSVSSHAQSPIGDLIVGYQATGIGNSLNFLNGRVAQLRIDGRVVPQAELTADAATGATVNATANTLYLGHFDQGSVQSSAGSYILRNSDQSIETYSPVGLLQSQADRFGNEVDYTWDASGRIQSISDHSIAGRSITFAYNGNSFTATDFAGRSMTYQLNAAGDLVSVTRTNQVPDPKTGVMSTQNATTSYAYSAGHLLQQVTDPLGDRTTVDYDQSYSHVVMVDNPIAYWRLGETSGATAADATAGSHPATISAGVTLAQGGALWADSNESMKFNGTSSYLSVPYVTALVPTSALTLETWFRTSANPSVTAILLDDENGTFAKGAKLNYDTGGHASLQIDPSTVISSGVLTLNTWHHVVGTYDGTNARLYVDGVLVAGPTAATYLPNDGGAITMGAITNGGSNFWNGGLDEPAIYNSALSATRIQAHFIAGRLGFTASPSGYAAQVAYDDPVGYWRLGDSVGTRAFDQSGTGNLGKATGGVTLVQSGALTTDAETSTSFDGSSGYITTGAVGSLPRWTLEAWIDPSAGQSTDAAVLSDVYSTLINYVIFFNPTGSTPLGLVAGFYDGAGWHYTTPVNVPLGTWTHVAATYDGAAVRVYLDGTLVATLTYSASPSSNGLGFRIGRRWDTTNYFAGGIQEAAVYPSALGASRILAHYTAGRAATIAGAPYPKSVGADSPAGYWRLGETTGTSATDASGGGHPGTYIGGAGVTLAQVGAIPNDVDYAGHFNGTTGYVSLGDPTAFQVSSGTIEAWVNTTTTAQSAIVSKLSAWWFGVQSTGKLGFYDMTAGVMRDSGVVVNDGRWHQVAATFQSGVAGGSQMYVDGKAAGAAFQMTVSNQTNEAEIASYSGGTTQFLNGSVDEVAIYPTVLPAGRILTHYQSARLSPITTIGTSVSSYAGGIAADAPVGFWRLDEPSGLAAQDRSGSNNAGSYSSAGVTLGQPGALATDSDPTATFNGSTGYVSVPSSASMNIAGPMTIEAWIKKTVTGTGPIVEYNNGSAVGVHFWNYATTDALYVNFVDTAGATHNLQSAGGLIALNTWYQVVAVYDGAYGSIYVDGVLVARTYLGAFTPQTSYPLYIARRPSGSPNYYLNASIADVAVYPYALTADRVLAHYNLSWDFTQQRVASVQDARGNSIASFSYNENVATTQVIDGRGLPSYYAYQASGARTLATTDTGNNLTSYQYDTGAPYRLTATSSPTVLQTYSTMNTTAPIGQQGQVLMQDSSGQPRPTNSYLMNGGYPDPSLYGASTLYTTNESWIWDATVGLQPGIMSHRSTPGVGTHQHYLTFANAVLVPAGSSVTQWVYIEPGTQAPSELELQFQATDSTGWNHRAAWGPYGFFGAFGCPANCQQSGSLPVGGRWVQLNVNLGPTEGASPQSDVDMAGRFMNGIAFTLYGGTGSVWWGPTMFTFPGSAVTDPTRAITRNAYNATNDLIASVDPNGIATVNEIDSNGRTIMTSTGVEPIPPVTLFQDNVSAIGTSAWQQEFGYAGTSAAAVTTPQHLGIGSLTQTHTGSGLQSDLYKDVSGLSSGTYVRVSVWVQTSTGGTGLGGASLMVENHLSGSLNNQRRSASVQSAGQWVQLTLPFVVDGSGQLRIHLWQENFQGTTTWADMHVDDLTPAPDVTLQHPLGVFASGFEVQPDSTWTLGTAAALNDPTQAHTGQYSIKDTLTSSTTANTVSRTVSLPTNATYRVSVWVRTVVSGGHGGTGGVELCAQFSSQTCAPSTTTYATTEGQWQQLSLALAGSSTLTLQLKHANWQGDVFWDDVSVERVADATPASSGTWRGTGWTGTVTSGNGAAATWASSWTGGIGTGASRQVTVSSPGLTGDIADTLPTAALRTGATYVISVWASSTVAGGTIDFSLRDGGNHVIPMDLPSTCSISTTLSLCQNSVTWNGADNTSGFLDILYGGGAWPRTITIAHPEEALSSQRRAYTAYGQLQRTFDIFGRDTQMVFDSNSLYAIAQVQKMASVYGTRERASYSATVAADGPLGYWRLGDTPGVNAQDASGHGRNGTYTGVVLPGQPGGLSGDSSTSASFDGSSGYVSAPNLGLTTGATLEGWVKSNGAWSAGFEMAVTASSTGDYLAVYAGRPYASFVIGGTQHTLDSGLTISTGAWHYLAATWDGFTIRVYVDGSLAASQIVPAGTLNETTGVDIGMLGSSYYFNGSLQDVAIYGAALTPGRIQAHYWAGVSQVTSTAPTYSSSVLADNPAGYWPLNDSSGTTAADSSGNGNPGSLSGGITLNEPGASQDGANSMAFNGSTGVITIPNATAVNPISALTMEAWVYLPATPSVFTGIIDKDRWDQYRLGVGGNPLATVRVWNGTTANYVDNCPGGPSIPALSLNQWHQLVYTFDGVAGQVAWYIDGTQICTSNQTDNGNSLSSYNTLLTTTLPLVIGEDTGASGYFSGRISGVALYASALSAARVLAHFQASQMQFPNQAAYATNTLSDRPAGYWRLGDGTGGLVSDSTGNGNVGSISGGVTLSVGGVTADGDTAAAFDGSSGAITISNSAALNPLKTLTMEAWVYTPATPPAFGDVIDKGSWNEYRLGLGNTPVATIQVTNGSAYNFVGNCPGQSAPPALSLNQWHHLAYTFDGNAGVVTWYVDGAVLCSSTQTDNGNPLTVYNTLASNTNPLVIGHDTGGGGFYSGRVDEVAVYGTALSAARILSHYQSSALGGSSIVTGLQYNSLGQRVATVRFNGAQAIVDQLQLDSWGRLAREIKNSSSAPADQQTNVVTGYGFDLNGQLTDTFTQGTQAGTWIDSHNDYDTDGNTIDRIANYISGQQETASVNVTTRMTYDAMNEVTDVASPLATAGGSTVTHTVFDTTGRESQSIANYVVGAQADYQTNVTTTTTYDSDGRVLTVLKPMGSGQVPTVNTYDVLGRLVKQVVGTLTPPAGFLGATAETDWTFDLGSRITDILGPGTGSPAVRYDTHYDLDALGRKLALTEAYGCTSPCVPATSKTTYDPRGATVNYSPPSQQMPGGVATRTETDLLGHTLRTILNWQSGAGTAADLNVATSYTYDGLGRVVTVTDPRGVVTTTTYDALDRHTTVTLDPSGLNLAKSSVYSLAGDLIQVVTPRDGTNRTDQTVYDALHRPVTVYQNCVNCLSGGTHDFQTNVETDTSYDSLGHKLTTTDALGRVTRTDYDHLGRKIDQIVDCNPANTCAGTPTFDQNVKTVWTIDSSGLTLAELSPRTGGTDNTNLTTGYGYDVLGNLTSVVEDKGSSANGHLNLTTNYTFDPAGDLVSMTDPGTHTTTYALDQFAQIYKVTDAVGNVVQTNRSLAGEVTSIVNGRGKTNTFTLDRLGRALTETYFKADGVTSGTVSYGYDPAGNQTTFADSDVGTTTVTFDNAGRVQQVSGPTGTTSYTYFLDGSQHTVTDVTGVTTFTEDQLGRIATAKDPLESGTTAYTLDALGRTTGRTEASGITTAASFSGVDQLTSKTESAGSSQFASWTNQYDFAGNRTQETSTIPSDTFAGTATFGYDTAQRLSSAAQPTQSTLSYGYDPASNRNTVSGGTAPRGSTAFAYLANNALNTETPTGQSQIAYAPDADGNITRDAAGHYLHFDSLNRLESIYDSTNSTLLVSYTYDALGRLATRTASGSTVTLVYRGTGQEVVSELAGGTTLRNYAVDSRGRSLAVQIVGTGTYTLLSDPHGDVVALAAGTGVIQGWVHFDPWGQILGWGGTQIPFGYQDDFTEPVNGYVRMGVRWYDPRQGRFVTEDPSALGADKKSPLDRQLWLYAIDSPLDYADVTGLSSCAWWDAVCKAKEAFNAAANAFKSAVSYVTNVVDDAAGWVSDRADDARRWIKEKGAEAVKWVNDRINDAQGLIDGATKFVKSRASQISRTLRTGAAAARSWAGKNLPKAADFAKSGLSKVAEKASVPLIVIGFGLQVYDNVANKHEGLGEAITRAALDTAGGVVGAALGGVVCGLLGVADVATLGWGTAAALIGCGVALIGLTYGGTWLGDRLGDWIFSPHPDPPGMQCKNIVQFRCTYSPPVVAA